MPKNAIKLCIESAQNYKTQRINKKLSLLQKIYCSAVFFFGTNFTEALTG